MHGVYGARHAVPGVSRANLIAWQRSFRLPQTCRPSSFRTTLKKNEVIIRILYAAEIVYSTLTRSQRYHTKTRYAKNQQYEYLGISVSLKIHYFINAHLPFPFLYRRSEARNNPSPKYWAACTHIRGYIVLCLVAATENKSSLDAIRSWTFSLFLLFYFLYWKKY